MTSPKDTQEPLKQISPLETQRGKVRQEVQDNLNPLAYATAFRDTQGNLDQLDQSLEFRRQFDLFHRDIQKKVQKNFYQRMGYDVATGMKKNLKQTQTVLTDIAKSMAGDQTVETKWNELVRLDSTVAFAAMLPLAYNYMSGNMQQSLVKQYQREEALKDGNMKKWSKRALVTLKPALITALVMQPVTLKVAGGVLNAAGDVVVKGGEVFKNVVFGLPSGEIFNEFKNIGKGGDPVEYLWNGKVSSERRFDKLKEPMLYSTPEKLKKFYSPQLQRYYTAMSKYESNPKLVETQIDAMSLFAYRAAKTSMSDKEMMHFMASLEGNRWDEVKVRRAMLMSATGGIFKFFMEDASPQHKAKFLAEMRRQNNRKFAPRSFSEKEIGSYVPGINATTKPNEKRGIRSALGLGASGLVIGAFIFTQLFTRGLFKITQEPFEFFEWEQGRARVGKKISEGFKSQKNKLSRFTGREKDKFLALTEQKRYKDKFKMLSKKDGALTEVELKNLMSSKLTNRHRREISLAVDEFMEKKKRSKISATEFWDLKPLKKLKAKKLREE